MSINKEPIKQKEILESKLQIQLLRKSITCLGRSLDVEKMGDGRLNAKNKQDFIKLFKLRSMDLIDYNIVTYGLAFSTLILFSRGYLDIIESGMMNVYIDMMEDESYWLNSGYDDFSIEVAILFVYVFFLNVYVECHIDFAVLNSCDDNKSLNRRLKAIMIKINKDDSLRLKS